MKRILLSIFILIATVPANAAAFPDAGIIQVHDMQMINQQKFRMDEINDYNDVQQEKERYRKKQEQPKTIMQKILNKESKFVEDEGKIKIQYEE